MARCPDQCVNLDDSDETFFCPDLDKDPGEARDIDAPDEDDDGFFEQAYAGPATDETFFEQVENALRAVGGRHEYEDDEASVIPSSQVHTQVLLPDTDETFYEPAERGRLEAAGRPWPPQGTRLDGHLVIENGVRHRPRQGSNHDSQGTSWGADLAAPSNLFTHDLEWSQCWQQQDREIVDGADDDLYVQLQDPVTQEMRVFKLSGAQSAPETLRVLTQDLAWTHQLVPPCQEQEGEQGACSMGLFTQDLEWTEQDTPDQAMEAVCASNEPKGLGGSSVQLTAQDLDTQSNQTMALGTASSGDQSMMDAGTGCCAASCAARPPRGGYSSTESSEAHADAVPAVPSQPSFDDDGPLPPVTTALLPDDHRRIEEIVASLSSISFDRDTAVVLAGHGTTRVVVDATALAPATPPSAPPPPKSPTFSGTSRRRCRRPRPRAKTGPPDVGRPGGCTTDPRLSGAPTSCPCPWPARQALAPGKRKRTGAGSQQGKQGRGQSQSASQSQFPITCSPLSPPRQKPRRSCAPQPQPGKEARPEVALSCSPVSPPRPKSRKSGPLQPQSILNQENPGLMAAYNRLQELRFSMQDILGGRAEFPTAEQVAGMQQEVQAIIDSMKQAARSEGPQSSKARQKREQAQQVADKLLHQFRVINESQESCVATEGSTESNPQAMSWSDTMLKGPCDIAPVESTIETESRLKEDKFHTSQHISSQKNHMKRRGRKSGKKKGTKQNSRSCSKVTQKTNVGATNHQNEENKGTCCNTSTKQDVTVMRDIINTHLVDSSTSTLHYKDTCTTENPQNSIFTEIATKCVPIASEWTCIISRDDNSNCPQTNIESGATCEASIVDGNELIDSSVCGFVGTENLLGMDAEDSKDVNMSLEANNEIGNEKQAEYQEIVKLIKMKAAKPVEHESEDFIWRGGPLKLTGVLLPKRSELEPIDDLPPNFWGNPQAPIPEEWISMLDWDD